ncbi:ABC transporter ATP-binding protein [Sphaerisporangium perillae]|uniref:ABC transporter ATP-binding protein n=1 Tax=Sphaerisporangium perillae TaxID=2935860 RepID=UPI00200EE38C|nr:ATP-binding cassette domain-containing protein [Sphaerisporangium perillae]
MSGDGIDGVAIRATGLSLKGGHGWVYRDATLDVPVGGLAAIVGEAGSGRTSLLLTLGGRMRPTEGTLSVLGHTARRRVRRVAALGLVQGVNELDDALSVREHLHERLRLRGPEWRPALLRSRPRHDPRLIAETALARAGLDLAALPEADRTLARHLARDQRVRLGIALALLDEPEVLLVDDLGGGLREDRRAGLVSTLRALSGQGLTVVAVDTEPLERAAPVLSLPHTADGLPDGTVGDTSQDTPDGTVEDAVDGTTGGIPDDAEEDKS